MTKKASYSAKLKDPRWQKRRLEIFNRDNFSCKMCNSKENTLVVHHLKYSGEPWDVPDEFLVTLCESCHSIEHENRNRSEQYLLEVFRESGFLSDHLDWISDVFSLRAYDPDDVALLIMSVLRRGSRHINYNEILIDAVSYCEEDPSVPIIQRWVNKSKML